MVKLRLLKQILVAPVAHTFEIGFNLIICPVNFY